jgi:alkanesulfonate monooxygenase SsuD/methylene tetrahydromethanopterin reductase-like flavin-dependent oxidoreductase (luciferase family)
MDVGIGLPAMIPGVDRSSLLEWARQAEERGFSSLGTLDRLVYPNYEPLMSLAAAAAVTERIRLTTDVLLLPWRANYALVAKQTATLDSVSGGRLTLSVAMGRREDDYEASGVPMAERARLFEEALARMKEVWEGDEIGPPPVQEGGPQLLIGGAGDATFRRAAEYGDGWTMGGGTPDQLKESVEQLRAAWSNAGREGEPRVLALCYFALGPNARETADHDLRHYYTWLGDELAEMIAQSAAVDEDMARGYRDAFADAGADELIYFPTSKDPEQVDLLAEAVL